MQHCRLIESANEVSVLFALNLLAQSVLDTRLNAFDGALDFCLIDGDSFLFRVRVCVWGLMMCLSYAPYLAKERVVIFCERLVI